MQSEIENQYITDSAALSDSKWSSDDLSEAQYLTGLIPDSIVQAANYKAMNNIYLNTTIAGIDSFTSGQWDTIKCLAKKCPYVAGDAVYIARALYAQIDNTIFFNDLAICQPSGSERMLMLPPPAISDTVNKPTEFVHLYPNPTNQLINLSFYAQTNGQVIFEMMDQLGEVVMSEQLNSGQTFAQYSVGNLGNAIYYWRLKDRSRTIKVGKIAVMK